MKTLAMSKLCRVPRSGWLPCLLIISLLLSSLQVQAASSDENKPAGVPFIVAATVHTGSEVIRVPGTSNLWLAGMPDGSSARGYDFAPAQSPILLGWPPLTHDAALTFEATGTVSNGGCGDPYCPTNGPDGGFKPDETPFLHQFENGIPTLGAPINSLIGVFLGPDRPDLDPTPMPAGLDFNEPLSQEYLVLSPLLRQPFFIGDGLTSAGSQQQVIVPLGATRLFLGTMDGGEWNNNRGFFMVTVKAGVPPDNVAPTCVWTPATYDAQGNKWWTAKLQDTGSGFGKIDNVYNYLPANLQGPAEPYYKNAAGEAVTPVPAGMTDPVYIGFKETNSPARIRFDAFDLASNKTACDAIFALMERDKGKPESQTFNNVVATEHYVTVYNGSPGLKNLDVVVNGKKFKVVGNKDGEVIVLDIATAMKAGNSNSITLTTAGKPGSKAQVVIAGHIAEGTVVRAAEVEEVSDSATNILFLPLITR